MRFLDRVKVTPLGLPGPPLTSSFLMTYYLGYYSPFLSRVAPSELGSNDYQPHLTALCL